MHGHHAPPPHHRHGPNLAAQAAAQANRRAIAQLNAFARRMNAQAFARGRFERKKRDAYEQALRERRRRLEALQASLRIALARPVDASPHHYQRGLGLFLPSNWTGPDGIERVVLDCNTRLPGSGRRAAAFVLRGADFEWADLEKESLDRVCGRGRLWVFVTNMSFENDEAYVLRAATFQEREGGPLGAWSFPTAGLYRGKPFLVGSSGLGAFTEPGHEPLLVARPSQYEARLSEWIWAGRSSVVIGDKLQVVADSLLLAGEAAQVRFLLPRSVEGSDIVALRCTANDDLGDPLAIVDTRDRPTHGIVRIDQTLHFFARPNQRDQQGRLLFAGKAIRNAASEAVFHVPFNDAGEQIIVELLANHRDAQGNHWFLSYPTAKDKARGLPLVLVALRHG